MQRIGEVHNHQAHIGGDIGDLPGKLDMPRAVQHAIGVPGHGALQELIAELAIGQRLDIDHDQPLDAVGHRRIAVDGQERLLLIDLPQFLGAAQRVYRLVGRQRHAGRVFRRDARVMAEF